MTAAFNVYAFNKADSSTADLRRRNIPEWNLARAVEWAVGKGVDTILVEIADGAAAADRLVTHHVCADPDCPGGC
jgi:hypothetical protein